VADTDTQTADDTRTTGGSGPGFTLLGAIVALGTGVALARRLD